MEKFEERPLVSIIVPTYNSQSTIRQCLQSISNQAYKKIEIIVVDRHSKDNTVQMAKEFNAKVLFVTQERSAAKNYAARRALGEFLLFIDSDMTLASKVVEECVSESLKTEADAVVIPLRATSESRLGECRRIERESLSNLTELMDAPRFFRKIPFLEAGGYDEELVVGEDFDLTQRFKKMGCKIDKIDSVIFHFEGAPSMRSILSKAYYYGLNLPALMKKGPRKTVVRYTSIRFESLKITGHAFRNVAFLFSFTVMKTLEVVAYFAGIFAQLFSDSARKSGIGTLKNKLTASKWAIFSSAILVLVSTMIFRNLFSPDWPGGGDVIGFVSRAYLFGKDFRWLYLWREHSFGFVEGINSMDFFFMVFYWIFRSPSWAVKVFMYLSYLAAGFSMYFFAYRYTRKHIAALSASLFYILNQWLFSQLTEAHADIVFSYALAPLIFILVDNALKTGKPRDIALSSVGLSLFITGFHPECIVIYGVFLTIFVLFFLFYSSKSERFQVRFYKLLRVSAVSSVLVFLLSGFFLVPFFFNIRAPYLLPSYMYPIEDSFGASYANVTDAFTLRAVEKWGYVNVVDVYSGLGLPDFPVSVFLLGILLLAYGTLLVRRDRYTFFFAFSTVISVFLAKGPHPPFGQFFVWAWTNVPHFAIFRAANRWIVMAIFSDAFFVSILVYYLARYVEGKSFARSFDGYFKVKVKNNKSSKIRKLVVTVDFFNSLLKKSRKVIYALSIILLVFILLSGFLSCFFFFIEGLQVYTPSEKYLAAYEWLASQHGDYKIISVCSSPSEWYDPSSGESDFASGGMLTTLGWSHDIGSESSFIHDKPTLQNGGWNFKSRQFVDYLRFRLARGHLSDNLLKILGAFAYDYVVIPSYITNQTRAFFLNQKGFFVERNESEMILRNEYATPRIFAANQSMFLVGGFESFDALCKIESFDLSKTILTCAPESIEDDATLYRMIDEAQMFCLANSNLLDLAMISLGKDAVVIHAGDYGFSGSNMTGHWVRWPSWRIIGAFVLGGDMLTTVGKNKIDIPFEVGNDGSYDIFLRIGFAPSRGQLRLSVDGESVREIRSNFPLMSKLDWVNMATLNLNKGKHIVTLENDGTGYNDVDAIAIVKPSSLESQIGKIVNHLQSYQGRFLYLLEAENTFLNVSGGNWYWTVSPYNGYVIRSESSGLNIAPSASANVTSETEFMEARRAIDGDLRSRWTSEKDVLPQWLELTWNTTQRPRGVRVVFENAYATDYAVQTWNGTCWIDQAIVAGNTELTRVHEFSELVETSKLRILVTGFSNFDRVSIWELEAYSADMTSASSVLTIPRSGKYMLAARVGKGSDHGVLYFQVNDKIQSVPCNSSTSRYEWAEVGPFNLTAGNATISIGNVGLVELDEVLLYSLNEGETSLSPDVLFNSSRPQVSVSFEKVNPCTFKVHVDASEPFTLVFSDTYDPFWKVFIGRETISSTPAYSLVNSFRINKTGSYTLDIYYTGQTYADVGLVISLGSFSSLGVLTLVQLREFKKRRASDRESLRRGCCLERR